MTLIKDLYKNKIDRPLNPAVSAEDFSEDTIRTEINEYVFTDEIINGLYNVLYAIWTHNVSHNGIWINGFFGSGKSHFLKYLGYCINPTHREAALDRLSQAVSERDPLTVQASKSTVTIDDMNQLRAWLGKASIDIVLFNIGTVHDTNSEEKQVFTQVFWNQFNHFRGYNSFNLALAQNLEKVLDHAGKFEEFKKKLAGEGFDWDEQAAMLATVYLDHVLEIAKELLPVMSVEPVRKAIMDDKENVSPEAFCSELKEYVDARNDKNYRLLFLVDEVSQFISNREYLLLQLQEVVTGLNKYCADKVWVACTAQQDLSQLMSNMQIVSTSEDYGKIMGRFEVRVSLKGTQTEYITQKRLLDKTPEGAQLLENLWEDKHLAIEDQFSLPASFNSFHSEEDFVNYYPFVPYQFNLIKKVLESFNSLHYIDSQSRGNERSIIKITHRTAVANMEDEVGKFISFDKFYNAMFEGALMASGQRAISNATNMIREYDDTAFAQRVVNVLFMICNLSSPDKLLFPATEEHLVTLMMEDIDTNKAELISRIERTLSFLDRKHIIRTEKFTDGQTDIYCFQSEDEIDAAREISSMQIDPATLADAFFKMFTRHFKNPSNKETYCTRSFSIGWSIYGRSFFANNADINVEFLIGKTSGNEGWWGNEQNKLTFNIEKELTKDKLLSNDFFWYCQVQKFAAEGINSESRRKTVEAFSKRAQEVYEKRIVLKFNNILNKCEVISGNTEITVSGEGAARYKNALEQHLANVYTHAKMVVGDNVPSSLDVLREKIQRPIEAGEYGPINLICNAEQEIDQYIRGQFGTVYVSDIVKHFAGKPYGWSDFSIIYFLNELRRRGIRSFKYKNDGNIDNRIVAQYIVKEQNNFTVVEASAISQDLINRFVESWKYALNVVSAPSSYDSGELFRLCKDTNAAAGEKHVSIGSIKKSYTQIRNNVAAYPFVSVVDDALNLLEHWGEERDHKKFFELVINEREKGREIFDRFKTLNAFIKDHIDGYKRIREFVEKNYDNFAFLPAQDKVEKLSAILTDEWPMPNMKTYAQLTRELTKELEAVKQEKKSEIRKNYEVVFEELRHVCAENDVPYNINEQNVLTGLTGSDNLYILKNNTNVGDYRAREIKKIMESRPLPSTSGESDSGDSGSNGDNEPKSKPTRTVRMVSLHTGSTFPLNNEKDVDDYLAKLKIQLMKYVNSRQANDDIMVK